MNRKTMVFDDEVLEYIDKYSVNNGVQKLWVANEIIKKYMNESIENQTLKEIEIIRQSIKFTDNNIELLIEAMNTLFISLNIENAVTSDMLKAPVLNQLESAVKKKIEKNHRNRNKQ